MVSMTQAGHSKQQPGEALGLQLLALFGKLTEFFTAFFIILFWQGNFWCVVYWLPELMRDWNAYTHNFPLSLVALSFALLNLFLNSLYAKR